MFHNLRASILVGVIRIDSRTVHIGLQSKETFRLDHFRSTHVSGLGELVYVYLPKL